MNPLNRLSARLRYWLSVCEWRRWFRRMNDCEIVPSPALLPTRKFRVTADCAIDAMFQAGIPRLRSEWKFGKDCLSVLKVEACPNEGGPTWTVTVTYGDLGK